MMVRCSRRTERDHKVDGSDRDFDNAMAESFFATLKTEFYCRRGWPTRAGASKAVGAWIENRY